MLGQKKAAAFCTVSTNVRNSLIMSSAFLRIFDFRRDFLVNDCMSKGKFSDSLARIMGIRGITITELAKLSGIHYVQISGYLREDKKGKLPSLRNAVALAQALHCSLEELIGLERLKPVDIEKAPAPLTEKEARIVEAFNRLPDDHWLRRAIEQVLLTGNMEELRAAADAEGSKSKQADREPK